MSLKSDPELCSTYYALHYIYLLIYYYTSEKRKNVMSQRIIMIHEIWPKKFRGHTKNTFKYDEKKNPAKKESKSEFIIKYTLDI